MALHSKDPTIEGESSLDGSVRSRGGKEMEIGGKEWNVILVDFLDILGGGYGWNRF